MLPPRTPEFGRINLQMKTRNRVMRFQPPLKKTFCPTLLPLTIHNYNTPKSKNNKIMLCAFSSSVHNISTDKQISILSLRELNSESQCQSPQPGFQKFMSPKIVKANFIKRNWNLVILGNWVTWLRIHSNSHCNIFS